MKNMCKNIFNGVYFTFTEKKLINDWLRELYFSKKIKNYVSLLKNSEITKILNNKTFTEKQKGEKIYNYIRKMRYPVLTQTEERFKKIAHKLFLIAGIKVISPQYFEGNNIIFRNSSGIINKNSIPKKYSKLVFELENTFIRNNNENSF